MAAIRGTDTQPELFVRRALHRMGYRYHLHVRALPGTPDIVFTGRRKVIEVRGCFWHRHPGCVLAATPRTRVDFWEAKFQATVLRDERNTAALEAAGWAVLIIWECEIKGPYLGDRLRAFLGPRRGQSSPVAPQGGNGIPSDIKTW